MSRQWVWAACAAAAGVLAGASGAPADGIASDSFDYPAPGGLVGKAGGSGFGSNAWAAVTGQSDPALVPGSLEYSDGGSSVQTAGNRVAPVNTSRATRNLDAVEEVAGRIVWLGFRERFTGAGGMPTNHAGISLFSGPNATGTELFFGKPGSATNWGMDTSTENFAQIAGAVTDADKDAFIIARINYNANPASVSMWVNPPLNESLLGPAEVSGTQQHFNIASVRLSTGANSVGYEFDEFRMGTTFADVIPEPATSGVALLAGGLLALRRRRA